MKMFLPISDYLFCAGYKKHSHRNENIKKEISDYDCKRLGLQNCEQKQWCSKLLKKLSGLMPDVRTLFELEMNKLDVRENFDYRNLNISLEYNMYTSWVVKLLMELSTADETLSPKRETQISYNVYHIMYLMPVEVLDEIFNSESRAFQKVADEKHNYIVPLNKGGH